MSKVKRVHIDLETYGLDTNAAILSIGACCGKDEFYAEIGWENYVRDYPEFVIDPDTVYWWRTQGGFKYTQPPEALVTPSQAIHDLAAWLISIKMNSDPGTYFEYWANPPSFDLSILKYYMDKIGVNCPWTFREERDVRTARYIYASVFNDNDAVPLNNNHNALDDARNQEAMVEDILVDLKRSGV